jgi:hypothetical protein
VCALVLDAPPPGNSTSDAAYVCSAHLQHLGLSDGALVDLTATASGSMYTRTVRVQLLGAVVPPDAPSWHAAVGSDSQEGAACLVGVSPLTAHNLGLLHQLQPFLQQAGAAGGARDAPAATPAGMLQLRPAADSATAAAGLQQRVQGVRVAVAGSVVIRKVGQPLVTPLSGLPVAATAAGSTGRSEQQQPSGPEAAAAAAAGSSEGGAADGTPAAREDTAAPGGGSSADSDELLEQLQKHFTQRCR